MADDGDDDADDRCQPARHAGVEDGDHDEGVDEPDDGEPDVVGEARRRFGPRSPRQLGAADPSTPDDPYVQATLDYGIRYEQAVLEWFDALPAELARKTSSRPGRSGASRTSDS